MRSTIRSERTSLRRRPWSTCTCGAYLERYAYGSSVPLEATTPKTSYLYSYSRRTWSPLPLAATKGCGQGAGSASYSFRKEADGWMISKRSSILALWRIAALLFALIFTNQCYMERLFHPPQDPFILVRSPSQYYTNYNLYP